MVDTPVNQTPVSKNKSLCCPECDQLWNRCQCSTKKIDITDSVMGAIEAASRGEEDDSPDAFKGTVIASKYEVTDCLGEGGMGGVFLAEHVSLKKKFALKILRKGLVEDEFLVERLRREAQACAMLAHPNIVSVFDFGVTDNGFPFIVMEYLEGKDLSLIIDQKAQIDLNRVVKFTMQLCDGLGFAHQKGVIHRDLKPTNVIVTNPDTEIESVKVVDFGIAKMELPGGEMQHLTQTGEVLGSPAYMSPEQIQGEKIDARSDIYSLGCILYEMLTGKQLFRGHTMFATLEANLHQDPPKLEITPNDDPIKKPVYDVMYRCLDKDRESRYQSLSELKEELSNIVDTDKESKDKKLLPYVLIAVLVGIAVALTLYVVQMNSSQSTASQNGLPEVEVVNNFEDVFVGRMHDMTSSDTEAKVWFLKAFNSTGNVNGKLAAAAEFIDQSRSDLSKVSKKKKTAIIEEVNSVKTRAMRIVDQALEKDSSKLNKYIAAQVLYEYAEFLDKVAGYYKGDYRSRSGQKDAPTNVIVKHDRRVKSAHEQMISAYKKGIQLIESESRSGLILASYYAKLGENLDDVGKSESAARNLKQAIKLSDEADHSINSADLIEWHCDLAEAYINSHQIGKAKLEYKQAVGLYNKKLGSTPKKRIGELEKRLKKVLRGKID